MWRLGETPVYFQSAVDFETGGEIPEETEAPDFGSSIWGVPEDVRQATIVIDYVTPDIPASEGFTNAFQSGPYPIAESGESLLQAFDSLSSEQLYSLQLQLLINGFDTRHPDKILWGQPDPRSYKAYASAVGTAARSGLTLTQVLNRVQATPDALKRLSGSRGGQVRTNVIQHMSEEDLEAAALSGFQAATGHAATAEQQDRFIKAWRQKETTAQPETAGGGTFHITDPGNPATVAEAQARQDVPVDAQAYSRLQKFGVMLQALGV